MPDGAVHPGLQVTQHARCRVRVTVLETSGRFKQQKAGHKVTLMAVMVSHFPIRLKTYAEQVESVSSLTH